MTVKSRSEIKLIDNLITREELAKELGLSPRTITNWMSSGKLPCVRIGRRNMLLRSMIEIWVEKQRRKK